jgi:DNA-binding NtrC family response regulator
MDSPTVVIYDKQRPLLLQRSARVSVVAGPDRGQGRPLEQRRARVGTGPECDLVLTDPHVSRCHVELRVQDSGYLVRDLGSTNGTFYRGARVQEAELGPGAAVKIGMPLLRLEVGEQVSREIPPRALFGHLLGTSPAMQALYGLLAAVAPTDATVLIEGETGTGKEMVAEALHRESPRAGNLLGVVDCGAIPASLIESELFGHELGAFTGAVRSRAGSFERAHGGTLFLDEIGELPLELQPRLLRAIEQREVRRVGGDIVRKVDVRVIAATNRDLARDVEQGRFREDLYYRLAVVRVRIPPLRERREDIPELARHFLWQAGCVDHAAVLTPELLRLLGSRQWRGNVRELRNTIERAVAISGGAGLDLRAEEQPPPAGARPPARGLGEAGDWLAAMLPPGFLRRGYKEAKEELVDRFEVLYLTRLLGEHGPNLSRLAREAGVDRQIVRRMLRKHGLVGGAD